MSMATVCRVCLVNSMNLYNVQNDLQNVYERIAREKYKKVGYPVHMCYICLTVLRKCHRFMETARDTNNVLKQWYKQQNEMREARPLYTYSISNSELVSTFNEDMTSHYNIKVEEAQTEQEEVQQDVESHIDVNVDKTDIDEQTDCSELEVDSPNDRTYTETVEDNNDRQTDSMLDYDEDFEGTSSIAPNDHTNIETTINIISPHENDFPPIKEHKTHEAKPQHQTPETSGETTANSETSNDIVSCNSIPSQPDNMRHRNIKRKPTFDQNNYRNNRKTKIIDKIVKKNVIQSKNKKLARNCLRNRKNSYKLALNGCNNKDTNEINKFNCKTKVEQQLTSHVTSRSENQLFECITCHYKFAQKHHLTAHMRTHRGEKLFSCDICHYRFVRKDNLRSHMRTHTGEKPFTCNICPFRSAHKGDLTYHMRKHTGEKPFSCDVCDYKCARKGNLTSHMKKHTGEKPFSCDICHYKCARKGYIASHMKTHTGEKPFTCDICQYRSACKSSLTQHMSKHTGEKPFSCEICHYKCARKAHLASHMKTHTGEKPFSCDICHYKCARKAHLASHMKTHTGEKPFTCDICHYRSACKSSLTLHMSKHTGEKQFSCDICDYRCNRNQRLKRHLIARHVNKKTEISRRGHSR